MKIYNLFFLATDYVGNTHTVLRGTFSSLSKAQKIAELEVKRGENETFEGYQFDCYNLPANRLSVPIFTEEVPTDIYRNAPETALAFLIKAQDIDTLI